MGYHYTMGAKCITTKFSKIKDAEASRAPSRNRTRITSLRRRSLAVRPSLPVSKCFSGTGENRTHIVRFKRPMHYLVCHNPICSRCFVSVGVAGIEPATSSLPRTRSTPELHERGILLPATRGQFTLGNRFIAPEGNGQRRQKRAEPIRALYAVKKKVE